MYDILIVGAGTAGLSAAIYGCRAGKTVLMFEELIYGGQIVISPEVDNYPGIKHTTGYEFATELYEQAMELGTQMVFEKVISVEEKENSKVIYTDNGEYEGKTVIIATGAKNRPLGLEKEELLVGKGISYCATCDGAFFKGKNVAIAGGGNTAVEDAIYLSDICPQVYVIHRGDSLRGEAKLVETLKTKTNVSVIFQSKIIQLEGNDTLNGILVQQNNTLEETYLDVSAVFVAIGQMPQNQVFEKWVDLDKAGYIVAGEDCKTRTVGVFAAGDCRTKSVRQLATAASDGAVAAVTACDYINRL